MDNNIIQPCEIDQEFDNDNTDYSKCEYNYDRNKTFKNIFDILEAFVYAIISVLIIFTFFVRLTVVNGSSMESTLHNGEYLFVSNVFFSYEPENGDIVVIHGDFENYIEQTSNHQYDVNPTYSDPIVKRVIAISGQTIKIDFKTSEVFVDGVLIDEQYRNEDIMLPFTKRTDFLRQFKKDENGNLVLDDNNEPIAEYCYDPTTYILTATVPEGQYFVMGDNRNHSADSRHRDIGFIPKEFIVGKAIFRLSPFSTF